MQATKGLFLQVHSTAGSNQSMHRLATLAPAATCDGERDARVSACPVDTSLALPGLEPVAPS